MMKRVEKIPTYDDVSLVYVYLFRAVGVLPFKQSTTFYSILTYLLTAYFQVMNVIFMTMFLGDGWRMLMRNELEIDYVFEVVIIQGICVRFLIIYCRRRELAQLMRVCAKLWMLLTDDEKPRLVESFERKVRYLAHFFAWTTVATISFYMISAQLMRLPPAEVNGTERRVLPFRWYVDVQVQPWYQIVSIVQGTVCLSCVVILTAIEIAGPFLIMMACGYLRSIQIRLLAMAKETPSSDVLMNNYTTIQYKEDQVNKLSMSYVIESVKFHQKTMNFCQNIENFTRSLFIVQVMSTSYNISLIGLKLLENDPHALKYLLVLALNLLQFFSCQWIPEHLLSESKAIVDAAYGATLMHPEYEPEANRALLFMMLRAKRPAQMTAGGFVNLSLETFKRVREVRCVAKKLQIKMENPIETRILLGKLVLGDTSFHQVTFGIESLSDGYTFECFSMFTNAISFFTLLRSMND